MNHSRKYITDLQFVLDRLRVDLIDQVITTLHDARLRNRQIFIMGNGGSASTASHFVCDLAKNTRQRGWPNYRVIGLTDNMAIFSAYANDEGYETVFAEQLASFVHPGDVVIGISGSGNSANVINAIMFANKMGVRTIGFTGFDGGKLGPLVDINLNVPSNSIEQVEDVHLVLEHLICNGLRARTSSERVVDQAVLTYSDRNAFEENTLFYSLGSELESLDSHGKNQKRVFQDLILELSHELDLSLDQFSLLQRVLQLCLKYVDAVSGSILLFDEREEATYAALAYMDKLEVYRPQNLADILQQGLAGWVVKNRQPVLVMDTKDDSRWLNRPWEEKNRSRSAISVPFMAKDKVLAVATLVHPSADWFTQNDLALLASIAVYITVMALAPYTPTSAVSPSSRVS